MIYQDRDRGFWEYVCHVPDTASATGQVVLRGSDGRTKVVPAADVGDESKAYSLVAGRPADATGEAMKEILGNCRHVGTLRFVALPVFLAGTAALAREYLAPASPAAPFSGQLLLAQAGLVLSLVLLVFETVLSFNLIGWWRAFKARAQGTPWQGLLAHRNGVLLWLARLALFLPYPLSAAFWAQRIPGAVEIGLFAGTLLFAAPSVAVWVWAAHFRAAQ